MRGMDAAVERVERAIAAREPILLYGDYDVDGTTAVVLLKTAIEMLGGVVALSCAASAARRLRPAIERAGGGVCRRRAAGHHCRYGHARLR